jgi:hypothetical protein
MFDSVVTSSTYTIPTYSIGGTITGLTAGGLVLQNNAGDDLSVNSGATTFAFATRINSGTYSVTVKTQPTILNCAVSNGSGTANIDITTVSISCIKTLGTVTTLAGTAGTPGSADGTGIAARFNTPHGIASDGTNLYIADTLNFTIRKMVISTGQVSTIAGLAGSSGTSDGTGNIARFTNPIGITVIGSDLYVVDSANSSIRKIIISTGSVSTFAGTSGSTGNSDGTGTAARFFSPHYITSDGTNLYVTDTLNNTIRKIVISNAAVTTLAGTAGISGSTDGTGSAARFNYPTGIIRVGSDLYVSDMNTFIIRKIVIYTGVVTTIAGTAGVSGTTDGIGTSARFFNPLGLTSDGTNLYLSESSNCSIRKIAISNYAVSIYAGLAGTGGMNDAIGTNARFSGPMGINYSNGNLYTVEYGNHTIRKIE